MRKHLLFAFALLLGITTLQAKPVDVATAQRLGKSFVQHKALFAKNALQDLELAYTLRAENGMVTAFVFNFNGGFVIVAADDTSSPILGYSDCGNFNYETAPDGLRFMLDEISRGIATVAIQRHSASTDILNRWKDLEDYGVMNPAKGLPVVEPLIDLRWNQDYPYNMYVPTGCPTGCVATAMAQLMKYWNWPTSGTGEHSYNWNGQTLSANFGETTYDWDNMIPYYGNGATDEQKEAVATLMYHCGVSVNMMYEPDGSGAFSADVPVAISTYFSYSDQSTHISKGGDYDEWIALLKSNIDQGIPLYYSGQSSQGGHAFVCDGYDENDLFHFNWGWGGASNGWFLIDGENFDYSGSQAIVYDYVPDFVYNQMPKPAENLSVSIDSDVSRIGHLTWTNPTEVMNGESLETLTKVVVKRNGVVVAEIEDVTPGQAMTYDDEVPYFDQFDYSVMAVNGEVNGRTAHTSAVFGPYCEWTVIMTSANFQGWDGGGITVQNAAGTYIDFLTTTTASAQMQRFQMALGNNNLYWTAPNSNISNLSFKVKDAENQIVYQYEGPSSGLEAGLLRTLNNTCGNEVACEAPYNLKATVDPDNDRDVLLTWESDYAPEFGYCIYRDGLLFNMAHELQYVDRNTDIGGHCYYITALCSGGETANSNEYCISSGTGCEPPTDLHFSYTNNDKVQLDWVGPDNPALTGYYVYRKTGDEPFKRIKSVSANSTTCKDTGVTAGVVYQYSVSAYYRDIDCTSAYAYDLYDNDRFYVEVDWSNMPTGLKAELVESEENVQVSLSWREAFHATSYAIMRNNVEIGTTTTETEFVDTDLEAGETYCYQIVARGDGFEESSNEVCVETPAAPEPPVLPCSPPTSFSGQILAPDSETRIIRLEWQPPIDRTPDSYTLMIGDSLCMSGQYGITDTFYEIGIPVDIVAHYFFVLYAVYPECYSEPALTADGDSLIHITNLSVNEQSLLNVKLYPNPTHGQVTIEAEEMTTVGIYNLVGQCLMECVAKDGSVQFDLRGLQYGVYLVKVSTATGSVIEKVVKM